MNAKSLPQNVGGASGWLSGCLSIALLLVLSAAAFAGEPATGTDDAGIIIANFRKIVALEELPVASPRRQVAARAGQCLFFENRRLARALAERVSTAERAGDPTALDALLAAADSPQLRDGDRLALRGVLEDVVRLAKLPPQRLGRLRALVKSLDHTRTLFGKEMEAALAARPLAAGKPARPAWSAYAAEAAKEYPPESVIDELLQAAPTPEQQATPSAKGETPVEQARRQEWSGEQLPLDTVLLTFDDGPHPAYTRQVLDILARYHVKAIFFQVGQNLGQVRGGKPELTRNEDVERLILAAGHAVGNHSYDHPFLPKLDEAQVDREIDDTQALIDAAVPPGPSRTDLFRPPYGARNPLVLGEIAERHLRSVLWNIDSKDWADPVPQSIVHRVVQELERQGRGIVLLHDIHARTVEALPLLLDELIKRGFRFAWWDGKELAVQPAKAN